MFKNKILKLEKHCELLSDLVYIKTINLSNGMMAKGKNENIF